MALTIPQFVLPVVIPATSGPHITITLANSLAGATTIDVTIDAATYHNRRNYASGDELTVKIAAELQAAEAAHGTPTLGTWSAAAHGSVDGHARLKREPGDAVDDVTNLIFTATSVLPGSLCGFLTDTVPYTSRAGVGGDHYWDTNWLGRLWIPGTEVTDDQTWPLSDVRVAVGRSAGSVVIEFGEFDRREIVIPGVAGALVSNGFLADADQRSASPYTVTANDLNATLEHLWREHKLVTPIRYYPDKTDLAAYVEIEVAERGWLNDIRRAAVEMEEGRSVYVVRFPAMEYVSM